MTDVAPPKIEYPCDYPIKILGESRGDFIDTVFTMVKVHAPEIERHHLKIRDSKKGTFVSVHIVIVATGEQQLKEIHQYLLTYDAVKMVI